jgi:hypothetical protein
MSGVAQQSGGRGAHTPSQKLLDERREDRDFAATVKVAVVVVVVAVIIIAVLSNQNHPSSTPTPEVASAPSSSVTLTTPTPATAPDRTAECQRLYDDLNKRTPTLWRPFMQKCVQE